MSNELSSYEPTVKPGLHTTEFWLAVAAVAVGLIMVLTGDPDQGVELVKWAVVGYGASRGLSKL